MEFFFFSQMKEVAIFYRFGEYWAILWNVELYAAMFGKFVTFWAGLDTLRTIFRQFAGYRVIKEDCELYYSFGGVIFLVKQVFLVVLYHKT